MTDRDGESTQRLLRVDNRGVALLAANDIERGRDILANGYYWALLIANQNYTHVADLMTPFHDVEQLSALLIEKYGFAKERVIIVKDATQSEMRKELERIHKRVEESDSLLIYYAGHGVQENAYGGKGFWVPADGEAPSPETPYYRATWLPNILVHQAMQVSRAKHILLISDSCYSGTFRTEFTRTRGGFAQDEEFFYQLAAKTSRRGLTSGDLEPVADTGGQGHSIFAYHLLRTLKEARGMLNAHQLFQQLVAPVKNASQQSPQYFALETAGDRGGDFVFVPKP